MSKRAHRKRVREMWSKKWWKKQNQKPYKPNKRRKYEFEKGNIL